jgi:hypothetical protein
MERSLQQESKARSGMGPQHYESHGHGHKAEDGRQGCGVVLRNCFWGQASGAERPEALTDRTLSWGLAVEVTCMGQFFLVTGILKTVNKATASRNMEQLEQIVMGW